MVVAAEARAAADDSPPLVRAPLWVDRDDNDIPEPTEREVSELYDILRNTHSYAEMSVRSGLIP